MWCEMRAFHVTNMSSTRATVEQHCSITNVHIICSQVACTRCTFWPSQMCPHYLSQAHSGVFSSFLTHTVSHTNTLWHTHAHTNGSIYRWSLWKCNHRDKKRWKGLANEKKVKFELFTDGARSSQITAQKSALHPATMKDVRISTTPTISHASLLTFFRKVYLQPCYNNQEV